jgi:pimeloyl-ACP methyl ester carboxylesterase
MSKRFAIVVLVLVAVMMVTSVVSAQDEEEVVLNYDLGEPAAGELIDVDGRNVHVWCVGEGETTVWLENGWYALALNWYPFNTDLAEHTRVCAYDRAGLGWSEANGDNRSAGQTADEFAALIDTMGEEPFVLASWSCGAYTSQIYAAQHPEMVLGMVLFEGCPADYSPWAIETFPDQYMQDSVIGWLDYMYTDYVPRGVAGELTVEEMGGWGREVVAEEFGDAYLNLFTSPEYYRTTYWETFYGESGVSGAQVKAAVQVTDIPMKVIISSQGSTDDLSVYRQARDRMWQAMQYAQAALSTNSEVIWADTSHNVHRDDPELVINAILDVLSMVNGE